MNKTSRVTVNTNFYSSECSIGWKEKSHCLSILSFLTMVTLFLWKMRAGLVTLREMVFFAPWIQVKQTKEKKSILMESFFRKLSLK